MFLLMSSSMAVPLDVIYIIRDYYLTSHHVGSILWKRSSDDIIIIFKRVQGHRLCRTHGLSEIFCYLDCFTIPVAGQGHLYRVEPRVPDDVTLRDPSLLSSTCNETLSVKSSFHVYTGQPLFIPRGSHRSQRRYRVPRVPRVPRYVVPGWNDRPDDDNGTQTCYSDDELLHDDYDAQCYYEERKTPRAKQRYHNTRCRKRATRIKNTNKLVRRKVSKKRDYCRCRRQRIHKWLLDTH